MEGWVHNRLLEVAERLDYCFTSQGMCHGMTMRWIEAAFVGELNKFNERINILSGNVSEADLTKMHELGIKMTQGEVPSAIDVEFITSLYQDLHTQDLRLVEGIERAREKVRQHISLDSNERDLLEIPAFFESISIYSNPIRFTKIFDQKFSSKHSDLDSLSAFAGSAATVASGHIMTLCSKPIMYTNEEMQAYLRELAQAIKDSGYSENVGFMGSQFTHSMGFVYNPNIDEWSFLDINKWPIMTSISDIASTLVGARPYISMYMSAMVLTHSEDEVLALKSALQQVNEDHDFTMEMAMRQDQVNLVTLAAQHDDLVSVTKLCALSANLNPSGQRCSPFFIAAHKGHLECLKVLSSYGADINQVDEKGVHPMWSAAFAGQAETVLWLLKQPGIKVTPVERTVDEICQIGYLLEDNHPELLQRFSDFFDNKISPSIEGKSREDGGETLCCVSLQDIAFIMGDDELASQLESKNMSIKEKLNKLRNDDSSEKPAPNTPTL